MGEIQLSRMMEYADELAEEGKLLHAAQIYHKIIKAEPEFIEAYYELSTIYLDWGKYQAAERILLQALERNRENIEIIFLLGNLYLRIEQFDKAIELYKMLEGKRLPQVHFNMGIAYFYKNDIQKAEKHLRLTMKYDPDFPQINESLGEILIKKKAFSEAIKYLERSIKIDPYSWINHYLLGVAYASNYHWKEAYDHFVTAIDIDPGEPNGWQKCGEVLIQLHRFDEAEQYLKKALDLNPKLANAFVSLGTLSLQREEWDKAVTFFDKALDLEPDNSQAIEGKIKVKVLNKRMS